MSSVALRAVRTPLTKDASCRIVATTLAANNIVDNTVSSILASSRAAGPDAGRLRRHVLPDPSSAYEPFQGARSEDAELGRNSGRELAESQRSDLRVASAPKLPALVSWPAGVTGWHVDAGHGPGIPGVSANPLAGLSGLCRVCRWPADLALHPLCGSYCRPHFEAPTAGGCSDGHDAHGLCAGRAVVDRAGTALAHDRARVLPWHRECV